LVVDFLIRKASRNRHGTNYAVSCASPIASSDSPAVIELKLRSITLFLAQPRLLSDLNNGLNYNERKICKRRTVMTEEIRLKEGIMAEEIRVVEHYSASIANKVGEGARVLGALRDGGVNLIAFWGYKHGAGCAQLE
jgi:hypothetical protein